MDASETDPLARSIEAALASREVPVRCGPLWIFRAESPTAPVPALYTPMLCVVAQGAKEILLGGGRYTYGPGSFLLNSVPVPASGGVLRATPAEPCLWIMVELDPVLVGSVLLDAGTSPSSSRPLRTLDTPELTPDLLDAVLRLVRLVPSEPDFAFLAPPFLREIVYRLITGGEGLRLAQIAAHGSGVERVIRAVEWLRTNYDRPMRIEELARECGLSASSLHHRFKSVTAMSPLQYQKRLRLQEARRLMAGEGLDAAEAGYRVGYEDPSHFSREYRRLFGSPPRRHAAQGFSGGDRLLQVPSSR